MIKNILSTETITYASNLNEDQLKQKITEVFEQNNLSFVGKFISPQTFTAYDKWTIIAWYIPNFKRKSAYLKGNILKSGTGSLIHLEIKPNIMLSFAPIISVLVGIITLFTLDMTKENMQFHITGIVFIVVGVLYYSFGLFSKNRLQRNFETHVDLQKI